MSRFTIGDTVRIIYHAKYVNDDSQQHVGEVGTVNDRDTLAPDVKLASGRVITCAPEELEHVAGCAARPQDKAILEAAAALRVANKRYAVAAEALPSARAALEAANAELSKATAARTEAQSRLTQAASKLEIAE